MHPGWILIFAITLVFSAGCAEQLPREDEPQVVVVFAAASLTETFGSIKTAFEMENPGTQVALNMAGSQTLRLQVEQGAEADVLAFANEKQLQPLVDQQLAAPPVIFAENRMVIITPPDNPGRIHSVADLARPGVKLILAGEEVPAGGYAREVLERLGQDAELGETYPTDVLRNLVSDEENVKLVAAKVQLGEADAGIVYLSDATPELRIVEIPAPYNIVARYPISIVTNSQSGDMAERFVAFTLSTRGQRLLAEHGFQPVYLRQTWLHK
jgi:molybdate transport system substrate-binding protein